MSGLNRQDVRELLSDIAERTGLDFHDRHVDQLQETIGRAMQRAGCTSVSQFRRRLRLTPGAFDDFVGELTIGETYFFRDTRQFDVIRNDILPALLQRPAVHGVPRLWSAGCSSGEEAYSLAILLEELSPGGAERVLATDISHPALHRAREARYRDWSFRGESRSAVEPYLEFENGRHVLAPRVRRRVTFEYLNLATDTYPSLATDTWGVDLILCRNVLIYFDRDTIARVCRQLWQCLAPDGWLVLAASDPPAAEFADFDVVTTPAGLVFRRPPVTTPTSDTVVSVADLKQPLSSTPSPSAETPVDIAREPDVAEHVEEDPLAAARAALLRGDHQRAATLTLQATDSPEACALHVRALINISVDDAEGMCSQFAQQHRLSVELHFLHAIILMDLGRDAESLRQLRRLIFLDRSLSIAHFTQGTVLRRIGRLEQARRSFRNACQLCEALPPDEAVALGDGETVGQLLHASQQQLHLLTAAATADRSSGDRASENMFN